MADTLADKSAITERVVVDGKCITSQGPGTALEFALQIISSMCGRELADKVGAPMVPPDGMRLQ